MKRILVGLLFVSAAFAAFAPAQAQTRSIGDFDVAGWRGTARANADNRFSLCGVTRDYDSGITLLFSLSAKYRWSMGFVNPSWQLEPGRTYTITYSIDGSPPRAVSARADLPTSVLFDLPDDLELFRLFRRGNMLHATSGGLRLQFSLKGSSAALDELMRCVARNTEPARAAAPPSTASRAEAAAPRRATSEQKLDATKVIANILGRGTLSRFRIVTSGDVQANQIAVLRNADVAWLGLGVAGTLYIAPAGAGTIDEIGADIIASDAKACTGRFASGALTDGESRRVKRMFTTCNTEGQGNLHVHHILVPWHDGTIFSIAHMGLTDGANVAAADEEFREAIKAVVGL